MDDPAGPPPIIATSETGFVITNASSWKTIVILSSAFFCVAKDLARRAKHRAFCDATIARLARFHRLHLAGLLERIHGHVSQQLVPWMLRILLDLGNHLLHFFQHRRRRIIE